MVRSLKILDVELAPYVTDWGSVEDVKDVLLAQTQLFSGSHEISLIGGLDRFSPFYPGSLFYGRKLQNVLMQISVDGTELFSGFIRDVAQGGQSRETKITAENFFSKPSETIATLNVAGANPATAMLSLLDQAGVLAYADLASFYAAGGAAQAAGATVTLAYKAESKTTVLSAIQAISELASISVYVKNGVIMARAFEPYQGNGSGCRYPINSGYARNWGDLQQARDNVRNQVTIAWGASGSLTLTDQVSVKRLGQVRPFSFSTATGASLSVPDLSSAQFFAGRFLARCSTLRSTLDVEMGPEFLDAQLGDRHLVTSFNHGMFDVPCEIIETHRKIVENGLSLKLATL